MSLQLASAFVNVRLNTSTLAREIAAAEAMIRRSLADAGVVKVQIVMPPGGTGGAFATAAGGGPRPKPSDGGGQQAPQSPIPPVVPKPQDTPGGANLTQQRRTSGLAGAISSLDKSTSGIPRSVDALRTEVRRLRTQLRRGGFTPAGSRRERVRGALPAPPTEPRKFVMPRPVPGEPPMAQVLVDPEKIDQFWRTMPFGHIPKGHVPQPSDFSGARPESLAFWREALKTNRPVESPKLDLKSNQLFDDGRHRFAALRDRGEQVRVAVPIGQAKEFERRFGATPVPPRQRRLPAPAAAPEQRAAVPPRQRRLPGPGQNIIPTAPGQFLITRPPEEQARRQRRIEQRFGITRPGATAGGGGGGQRPPKGAAAAGGGRPSPFRIPIILDAKGLAARIRRIRQMIQGGLAGAGRVPVTPVPGGSRPPGGGRQAPAAAQVMRAESTMRGPGFVRGSLQIGAGILGAQAALKVLTFPITAVKNAADFEFQMVRVQAVTNATADEMERLKQQALSLGSRTMFPAAQIAEAQEVLGQKGLLPSEIERVTPTIIDVATAGRITPEQSADTLVGTMRAMQLPVEDIDRIGDVLTRAAIASSADMDKLRESLKFVGPVAGLAGQSVEDVAAALGVLSNSMLEASVGGTSFRRIMADMANPDKVKEFTKLLGQPIRFFDVDTGKLRNLADIVDDVNKALGPDASPEQRLNLAMDVFGQRGGPGFAIFLEQGGAALREMQKTMTDTGITARGVAQKDMDTLVGAGRRVAAAIEFVTIKAVLPMKDGLKSLGIGIADTVAQLADMETLQNMFTGLGTAFGSFSAPFMELVKSKEAGTFFDSLGTSIGSLTGHFRTLVTENRKVLETFGQFATVAVGIRLAGGAVLMLTRGVKGLAVALATLTLNPVVAGITLFTGALVLAIGKGDTFGEKMEDLFKNKIPQLIDGASFALRNFLDLLELGVFERLAQLHDAFPRVAETLSGMSRKQIDERRKTLTDRIVEDEADHQEQKKAAAHEVEVKRAEKFAAEKATKASEAREHANKAAEEAKLHPDKPGFQQLADQAEHESQLAEAEAALAQREAKDKRAGASSAAVKPPQAEAATETLQEKRQRQAAELDALKAKQQVESVPGAPIGGVVGFVTSAMIGAEPTADAPPGVPPQKSSAAAKAPAPTPAAEPPEARRAKERAQDDRQRSVETITQQTQGAEQVASVRDQRAAEAAQVQEAQRAEMAPDAVAPPQGIAAPVKAEPERPQPPGVPPKTQFEEHREQARQRAQQSRRKRSPLLKGGDFFDAAMRPLRRMLFGELPEEQPLAIADQEGINALNKFGGRPTTEEPRQKSTLDNVVVPGLPPVEQGTTRGADVPTDTNVIQGSTIRGPAPQGGVSPEQSSTRQQPASPVEGPSGASKVFSDAMTMMRGRGRLMFGLDDEADVRPPEQSRVPLTPEGAEFPPGFAFLGKGRASVPPSAAPTAPPKPLAEQIADKQRELAETDRQIAAQAPAAPAAPATEPPKPTLPPLVEAEQKRKADKQAFIDRRHEVINRTFPDDDEIDRRAKQTGMSRDDVVKHAESVQERARGRVQREADEMFPPLSREGFMEDAEEKFKRSTRSDKSIQSEVDRMPKAVELQEQIAAAKADEEAAERDRLSAVETFKTDAPALSPEFGQALEKWKAANPELSKRTLEAHGRGESAKSRGAEAQGALDQFRTSEAEKLRKREQTLQSQARRRAERQSRFLPSEAGGEAATPLSTARGELAQAMQQRDELLGKRRGLMDAGMLRGRGARGAFGLQLHDANRRVAMGQRNVAGLEAQAKKQKPRQNLLEKFGTREAFLADAERKRQASRLKDETVDEMAVEEGVFPVDIRERENKKLDRAKRRSERMADAVFGKASPKAPESKPEDDAKSRLGDIFSNIDKSEAFKSIGKFASGAGGKAADVLGAVTGLPLGELAGAAGAAAGVASQFGTEDADGKQVAAARGGATRGNARDNFQSQQFGLREFHSSIQSKVLSGEEKRNFKVQEEISKNTSKAASEAKNIVKAIQEQPRTATFG